MVHHQSAMLNLQLWLLNFNLFKLVCDAFDLVTKLFDSHVSVLFDFVDWNDFAFVYWTFFKEVLKAIL